MTIGKNIIRPDSFSKVTGKAKYIDDYVFPDMVSIATVRSPVAHGILNTGPEDITIPYNIEGIFTYKDISGTNMVPLVFDDYKFLPDSTVKFKGEAIALVAAKKYTQALSAAKFLESKLSIKELEPVFTISDSLKAETVKISGNDNIFKSFLIKKGNIDEGFKKSSVIVEDKFTTSHQVHSYLETQGMIAVPDNDGGIVVYGSMQCPFYVQNAVARIIGLPLSKVRIIQTETGGGFGGKEDIPSLVAGHAALVAWKLKKPAKLIYEREEDFLSASKRHPAEIYVKYGATDEGKIVACKVEYLVDGGAYTTLSPIVLWRGTIHATGPYEIENIHIESKAVATNKVPCGAFRGFGQPQVAFAQEGLIDEIGNILKLDPVEIRKRNILKIGKKTATGQTITESCGLEESIDKVITQSGWNQRKDKKGLGLSICYYGVNLGAFGKGLDKAGALVKIESDGSVTIGVGNTELGQGARCEFIQIASESLQIPPDKIKVLPSDTALVPDSGPTVASRATISSGNAILDACNIIKARLNDAAKQILEQEIVEVKDGIYRSKDKNLTYDELIKYASQKQIHLATQGWWKTPQTSFDINTGLGDTYIIYSFAAAVSETNINPVTLQPEVKKIWAAYDVGKAINPQMVKAQIEGGTVQALGYSLYETLAWKDGTILNPSFAGYIIPATKDVPEIEAIIVEHPYSDGPFGAKGFGETPMIVTPASIANGVSSLIGKRLKQLPITPEMIMEIKE